MKKIVRLNESDLTQIIKRVVNESDKKNKDLEDNIKIYNLYKKGEIPKKHFDMFMGILTRKEKEDLMDYIRNGKNKSDIQEMRRGSDDDEMFDLEIDKIKRALHDIKRMAHHDPQTVDHICNMIVNVSLPRLKEFR